MTTATTLITAEEFGAIPDDVTKSELIRGEVARFPYPEWIHGYVLMRIAGLLGRRIDRNVGTVYCGSGFILSRNPDTVLGPDVSVQLDPMSAPLNEPEYWTEDVPDFVFEVVSKHDLAMTLEEKAWLYLEAGVKTVVVVWPRLKRFTVRTPRGDSSLSAGDRLTFTDLPGVELTVDEIFSSSPSS
jgi:Uma2 family endonuclease